MGSFFQSIQHPKSVKNGHIFQEKSLKMGTFFCQEDPDTWVRVRRLKWQTHVQTECEYPPRKETLKQRFYNHGKKG